MQGNERQIDLIARGLIARGHTVHIAARPHSPAWDLFTAAGAHMSAVRPRGTADIISAFRFARWLRRLRPDAILFTSWRRLWIAGLAARAARVPNTVMRFGGRHDIPTGWRGAHYRQALLRFVDRIYANSTVVREHLLHELPGLEPARVHVIWNALEAGNAQPAAIRAELGMGAVPLVAAVGGLVPLKGFDVLIEALARSGSDAHLVICGEGSEREALRALAVSLDMTERVHLPGRRDDVPAVLAAADAFVLSSRTEGFSVALLEAMRAGLPIVATDVGGVRDALDPQGDRGLAGWIVSPDDVEGLGGTLRDVLASLDSPETRARAAEARRRVREDYTSDRMIDAIERILRGSGG